VADILIIIVLIVAVVFAVDLGRSWWRENAWRRGRDRRG
jgi:hypothetical protein